MPNDTSLFRRIHSPLFEYTQLRKNQSNLDGVCQPIVPRLYIDDYNLIKLRKIHIGVIIMEQRIYHGDVTPDDIAQTLVARFNRGNLRAQQVGSGKQVVVQVATRDRARSGGQTALSITLLQVEDGVSIQVGKQTWLGVAASLGVTALTAFTNPLSIIGRLDDLAQDIENLQITEDVWETIEAILKATGASFELSERLRRLVCSYCDSANPIVEPSCVACGAPLGGVQPSTCDNCGFVIKPEEQICPNCKQAVG
jgi:hypothetical protein